MRWPMLLAVLLVTACGGDDGKSANVTTDSTGAGGAAGAGPGNATVAPRRTLGAKGGGDFEIGITQALLRGRLGMARSELPVVECRYLEGVGHPSGIFFMLVRDSLARIDVRDSSWATDEGARVGDTEARVNELYGARVATSPHKYTGPQGHYMTVTPADSGYRIVFETDGQRVVNWRVGRVPEVEWVEGCS